jgi:copper resistance protein C
VPVIGRRALAIGIGVAAFSGHVHAHSRLRFSRPAEGETIAPAQGEFVLRFDEGAVLTSLRLFEESGGEVALRRTRDTTPAAEWRAAHPALRPGPHRLDWRALSADGHPVGGVLRFSVAPS